MPTESIMLTTNQIEIIYVLILWPEVQDLMGQPWFRKECILYNPSSDQECLDSAYFVPLKRILYLDKTF